MSLTVADLEARLLKRCGAAMGVVSMDATTQDGTNVDLADPLCYGAQLVGLEVANGLTVQAADLACLRPHLGQKLLDLAERRTLETVLDRFLYVDQSFTNDTKKSNNQFRKGLQVRIVELTDRIAQPYAPGVPVMRIGRDEPRRRRRHPGECGGAT